MSYKTLKQKENRKMWAAMTRKTRKRLRQNVRAVAEYKRTHLKEKTRGHKR